MELRYREGDGNQGRFEGQTVGQGRSLQHVCGGAGVWFRRGTEGARIALGEAPDLRWPTVPGPNPRLRRSVLGGTELGLNS